MDRWFGFLLIVVSAISFGAMAIFARIAYAAGVDPATLLLLRFAIAAATMIMVMMVRSEPFPHGRVLLGLIVMGAVGYVGQSLAFFTALTMASAGLVTLLLYLYPVLVSVLAAIVFRERLTPVRIAALGIALGGTALTVGPAGGGRLLGMVLAIAAAIIYAVYILAGSRITRHAGAIPSTTVIIASAAIVYAGIVAARGAVLPRTPLGWAAVLAVALISTVVAIVTFFAGMARIGPVNASMLSTLEPVVTVVLAALVLEEIIAPLQILGGALILTAVIILTHSETQRDQRKVGGSSLEASTPRR